MEIYTSAVENPHHFSEQISIDDPPDRGDLYAKNYLIDVINGFSYYSVHFGDFADKQIENYDKEEIKSLLLDELSSIIGSLIGNRGIIHLELGT